MGLIAQFAGLANCKMCYLLFMFIEHVNDFLFICKVYYLNEM